jgi:hypothetical protein
MQHGARRARLLSDVTLPIDLEGWPIHTGRRRRHCPGVGATNAGLFQVRNLNCHDQINIEAI